VPVPGYSRQWQIQVCSFIFLIIKQRMSATMKVKAAEYTTSYGKKCSGCFLYFSAY